MNKSIITKGRNLNSVLSLSGFVLVSLLVIVWFLPRNNTPQMRYDVGKPWMYASLIAKFDFPVYKSDAVIQQEKDSLLAYFQPYYNYDKGMERRQLGKLHADYPRGIPGLPAAQMRTLYDRLHRLYQAGIISTPQYNSIAKDSVNMVRVIIGKRVQSMQIGCIYSTLKAYEQLLRDNVLADYRTALQQANVVSYLQPNMTYDKNRTTTELNDLLGSVPLASGMVLSGQKIIDRGEIVNDYSYRVLASLEKETARRNVSKAEIKNTVIGQFIYVLMLLCLFTCFIVMFRPQYLGKARSVVMLYVMITVYPVMVSLFMEHSLLSVYIIPFAIGPMFIRVFMDSRTAFISHLVSMLICAVAVKYQFEFLLLQLISGLVAIYSLSDLSGRAQLFKCALFVTVANFVTFFTLQLMQTGDIGNFEVNMYSHFVANGVLLLLAYPLMFVIERTFGFTSNVTLFELSNTNKGMLRKMSEVAPGTFQHSITVGNLAAEIANRIGADSLLVRTGALYHDIGKMKAPVFFTENQVGVNPHKGLPYKESARIIISHVTEGLKMAEKANLPTFIREFILTHHGTGMAKYFYINYKNEHPDEEVDVRDFSYPGPDPFTREQAILMMADAVEAASRSLPEYTEESIKGLIDRMVDTQLEEGHFKECPITFRDIAVAKAVMLERLKSIYHTRVSYPELKQA
ncbi:HD family phosphohydrolase [Hoylesella loescheii]|uniref:7TM receptor with intracellular HD hydrolase n=1 Tax=Hoylesella loescheii DSM 19665 = JCM 12249 = ATCC 15930 TaxID=1122985 RepID=A0A069QII8_HOYLO|nr:HDIG domain-containing metalloprotein [Hoylesella loescheii]KDR52512.1 7TM receptor with intracellular HD hydrolase [Hoylesella loescheii DSM 19665 = JCM 12249 = ATCC 15930]